MTRRASLRLSIVRSALIYFILQCIAWVVSVSPATALRTPYIWFFPSSAGLHIGMAVLLLWRQDDFRHTRTRESLQRVNVACHLTLFRLSCAPTILFLAIAVSAGETRGAVLIAVVIVAFLSDFVDGQAARRLDQTTDIGKYLDSSTDYAVLLVLAIAFVILGITPPWYFGALMARFLGFAVAMLVLTRVQGRVTAETTFFGKAAVFSAMTTYAFESAHYLGLSRLGSGPIVSTLEIISAAILGLSAVDKVIYLVRKFRAVSADRRGRST